MKKVKYFFLNPKMFVNLSALLKKATYLIENQD